MLYDEEFYDEAYERNVKVAKTMMPVIIKCLSPKSIVDIGCGLGFFLHIAEENGIEVLGIDGDYINRDKLCINKESFMAADLGQPLDLHKRFDIAMSLEVAEHICEDSAEIFVDNITGLSDVIIFSAAVPGQGGGDMSMNNGPLIGMRSL